MPTFDEKLAAFAQLLECERLRGLKLQGTDCECNRLHCKTKVLPGKTWAKVDDATSGCYMVALVDNPAKDIKKGDIVGIKAYGVPNLIRRYGNLDTIHEWDWSDYRAVRVESQQPPKVEPPAGEGLMERGEAAFKRLLRAGFIGGSQAKAVASFLETSEEKEFFAEKMIEIEDIVKKMPSTKQTDGQDDKAVVYLHYFAGGASNWWITEKDVEKEQLQAFGLVNLYGEANGSDAELGYMSLREMTENDVEMDFHWTPKTLAQLKAGKD
jgi:hypothetical protein